MVEKRGPSSLFRLRSFSLKSLRRCEPSSIPRKRSLILNQGGFEMMSRGASCQGQFSCNVSQQTMFCSRISSARSRDSLPSCSPDNATRSRRIASRSSRFRVDLTTNSSTSTSWNPRNRRSVSSLRKSMLWPSYNSLCFRNIRAWKIPPPQDMSEKGSGIPLLVRSFRLTASRADSSSVTSSSLGGKLSFLMCFWKPGGRSARCMFVVCFLAFG